MQSLASQKPSDLAKAYNFALRKYSQDEKFKVTLL